MFLKYGLPLLAVVGLALAVFAIARTDRAPPPAAVTNLPASPYASSVVGLGIVEPNTESIAVGSPVGGVVASIFVKVGDDVAAGAPLFVLDDRAARAELAVRQAALGVARTSAAETRYQLHLAEQLVTTSAVPEEERETRRYHAETAAAQVAQAEAAVQAAQTELDRLTVRAPIAGRILQLKVHVGEFAAPAASVASPLLVLGNVTPFYVRAEIDEYDAPRITAGVRGTGFLRGDPKIRFPLKFVRFEPVVVPKRNLTGDPVERTDTRVLQVLLAIDQPAPSVFVGQQMDVFLAAHARPDR